MKILMLLFTALLISSCIVVPKKVEYYDRDCDVIAKNYELTATQLSLLEGINDCSDDDCVKQVTGYALGTAVVGTVSAIVSGSIVVAGNTVYWLEKQGRCKRADD
jgi:hypothetical protein